MPLLEIAFPSVDPVAFELFGLAVRWYGICWMLGFMVGLMILKREARKGRLWLTEAGAGDFLFYGMIATVLGGRLGYILFYNLDRYIAAPADVFAVWQGGLSFHGGVIGIILVCTWFVRRRKIPLHNLTDAVVLAACPGIFFVRCANFINGELWGRETDVSWAMVFPGAGPNPRHPSQLYEGIFEGLVLGAILWLVRARAWIKLQGRLSALFLMIYGAMRFVIEFFREPDEQFRSADEAHGFVLANLTMGQLLCLAMIAGGAVVWWVAGRIARPVGQRPESA